MGLQGLAQSFCEVRPHADVGDTGGGGGTGAWAPGALSLEPGAGGMKLGAQLQGRPQPCRS